MPSLNELKEFKASFHNVGGQKAALAAKKIPLDDLELPDSEPTPLPSPAEADSAIAAPPAEAETEAAAVGGAEPAAESVDGLDFSAFLGAQPQDLPDPPALDMAEELAAPAEQAASPGDEAGESSTEPSGEGSPLEGSPEAGQTAADLYAPEELLSNLSEELDAIPPESSESESAPLDLDSLDNFDMPEEPVDGGVTADSGESPGLDGLGDLDFPEESATAEPEPGAEPLAATDNGTPLESSAESASASEDSPLDLDSLDNFDMPDLSDDTESQGSHPEEPVTADEGESPALDLDNLGDLDLPAEAEPEAASADEGETPSLDLDNLGDLDLPAEAEPEAASADEAPADEGETPSLDLDNLGDLDLPAEAEPEAASADEAPADEGESPSLDLDNLGDLDLPAEAEPEAAPADEAPADEGESPALDLDNLGDLDLPGEPESADLPEEGEIDLGNFDDFEIPEDSDAAAESSGDSGSADGDLDDFSFPELDNVLEKSAKETKVSAAPKAKGKSKGKGWGKQKPKRVAATPDDVDEIKLSEDELEGLEETLSRYPLNLRVACEEIIVEHAVNPKQMSELIEHLVWGATAKETAVVAGRILGRTIIIPKAFQKSTGAALEAEQASFAYIFVHKFLPILRFFMFIAVIAASLFYLLFKFVYIPLKAEEIYKMGYERIFDGEYERANERFTEAFNIYRDKKWFYRYAEAFRDERQYIYAEQKYDELLYYYRRDKKGVLDYANMETYHLRNYAKADTLLRNQLLDYSPNDLDGLLAAGDNNLLWAEVEPSRYEDARYNYARALEKYGWRAPIVERMMKYFIRTDNLKEVLPLKAWFDNNKKYKLSAESLGELGGYLLDKKLEEVPGVPNEYVQYIDGIRDILLEAVYTDPTLPEPHYHLARYYQSLGNAYEERVSLRVAARAFNDAPEGSIRRITYHIDTLQRYADALINNREFMPAEEQLIKGINLYEDAVSRRLISRSPQFGKLYAGLGDLEYFTKADDMEAALRYYRRSEQNGWAPPEMQYRMGAAYYHLEDWKNALEYLYTASTGLPQNRRILFSLGNASLKRGDYFAAQGYYNRLLDILEVQRSRLPILLPNDRPEYLELAERLMMARNNAGVAYELLSAQTGNRNYYSRALAFYAEADRAWDARNRDPRTMIRSGSTPLPYLNSRNALYPQSGYEPQIFIRIDREAQEDSKWEELAPILRLEHGLSN